MANIDTYLTNIKNAVYGEEVRGSIHDAIEAINDEVEHSDTVNLRNSIAEQYSASKAYAVGDYAFYPATGVLYRCIQAGTGQTPGSGSAYWTAVELSDDVSDLKGSLPYNYGNVVVTSCNDVRTNSVYFNSVSATTATIPDFPFSNGGDAGWLFTTCTGKNNTNIVYQVAVRYVDGLKKYRIYQFGTWTNWTAEPTISDINASLINDGIDGISSCDDITRSGFRLITVTTTTNWPFSSPGFLLTYNSNGVQQIQYAIPWYGYGNTKIRIKQGGIWSAWKDQTIGSSVPEDQFTSRTNQIIAGVTVTYNGNCSWTFSGKATVNNSMNILYMGNTTTFPKGIEAGHRYYYTCDGAEKITVQTFSYINGEFATDGIQRHGGYIDVPQNATCILIRFELEKDVTYDETVNFRIYTGDINAILKDLNVQRIPVDKRTTLSCDDIDETITYFFAHHGGTVFDIIDPPFGSAGFLQTVCSINGFKYQIAYPLVVSANAQIKYRAYTATDWTAWTNLSGNSTTTTITQEVSRDTYNNTYNLTVSPQITTDSNGWLQAVDTDTADETGKTDMTSAIMAMLNSTGYCHLGPGIFYVSGNIDMPEGSMIEGCGKNTVIRLLSSVASGYCIQVHKYNTVKNLRLSGSYTDLGVPQSPNIGGRNGIIFVKETGMPLVQPIMLSNLWIENFTGSGLYCYNSGMGINETILMSDCFIRWCAAGINIALYSEYHKFTNVVIYQCHFACINNGGNNVFTACSFYGIVAFLMDGTAEGLGNLAHGSVVGCTFNHVKTLSQDPGIKIIAMPHGYIFTGCQIWYTDIYIEDSRGISFSNCLIGGETPSIAVTGSYGAYLNGCIFQNTPTLTVNSLTKIDGCYLSGSSTPVTV